MNTVKKQIKIQGNILSLDLPDAFRDKELEVIVKIREDIISEKLLLNEVEIDTRSWKFDREEIYNG
jgi:hypothetical protein